MKKLSRAVEKALNNRGWRYQRHQGGRVYALRMTIGSLESCRMQVRVGPDVVISMVAFPFDVPAHRMAAVSEFAHRFNDIEPAGNIDLDVETGLLRTRYSLIVGEKVPRKDVLKLAIERAPAMMQRIHLPLRAIVHHGVDGEGAFLDLLRAEGRAKPPSPPPPRPTERADDGSIRGRDGEPGAEAAGEGGGVDPEWLAEVLRVPPAAPWRPERRASDVPD